MIIDAELKVLYTDSFRPKKWAKTVQDNLKTKNINYSEPGIRAVLRGDFYNEEVAIEIISVFKNEPKRQENILKSL